MHNYTAQRVLRTLEIIALRPTTAPAVAAAIGVHPRTARRLLRTLAKEQYVERRGGARTAYEYQPTVRLLALASQLAARLPLVRHGQRAVNDLEQQTDLTAYLAVPSYADVLVVACAGKCALRPWDRLPAPGDAAGRVLLAHREPWRLSLAAAQPAPALGNATGCPLSSEAIERLADEFLASGRTIPLLGANRPAADPLRRSDGRVAPLLRDELRYSTPELLAIEQRIVDIAVHNAGVEVGLASEQWLGEALRRRPFLSQEQVSMVRRLTRAGGQIVAVVGKAGTGKTTALSAAREAWAASGLRVVGVAVARRAARELQESAGIPSTSLAALLLELRRGGSFALARGTVVVLDEASMVSSRDLGELLEFVVEAGGKLVLCGDHRQLPAIRAGGAFRGIIARTDAIQLSENRRQTTGWEREALDMLRDGAATNAIRVYEAHERLVLGGDRTAVIERLVKDWWAARADGPTAMIALRRADVKRLNEQARALMREAGLLGPDVTLRSGTFAVGDRVVLRRNDRRVGVVNGEVGVIEAVDREHGMGSVRCSV